MITRDDAERLAREYLRRMPVPVDILADQVMTTPYGWVFFYESAEYLQTGRIETVLLGNTPLLIEKATGAIHLCPSPLRESLERFERTGTTAPPDHAS